MELNPTGCFCVTLAIYGNGSYQGVPPRIAARSAEINKTFQEISNSSDQAQIYWKNNACNLFNIKEEKFNNQISGIWKYLFFSKSNDMVEISMICKESIQFLSNFYTNVNNEDSDSEDDLERKFSATDEHENNLGTLLIRKDKYLLNENADSSCQYYMGICLANGFGIKLSMHEAFKYLELAATQDHSKAKEVLKQLRVHYNKPCDNKPCAIQP